MSEPQHGWPAREPVGRIAYVNGRYIPHSIAAVHIEDRGLQFADAIYEVVGVTAGTFLDEEEHLARLARSVDEIGMPMPASPAVLKVITREMARRNRLRDGLIYFQITRGAVRRDHAAPDRPPRPTLIVTARSLDPTTIERRRQTGVRVISHPDERWARCDIKSTALLPNILAKTAARKAGAFEAWLVDKDGFVTEGSSTSAWIVTQEGRVITRDLTNAILPGVTRAIILKAAAEGQIPVVERKFTLAEAFAAKEAFITAATLGATAVIAIDGRQIGDGRPGALTRRVQELYRHAAAARGKP
ncbi:MAG: D-amino-acid transaminase [Alphaproteobacteria bacterium]|nr:D-amino-acid transaminase [Alphaproteobacteria bacterium]